MYFGVTLIFGAEKDSAQYFFGGGIMVLTLDKFISHINDAAKKDFLFAVKYADGTELPVEINIRFNRLKHKKKLTAEAHALLCESVDFRSRGSIHVATSIKAFESGIIDLKVSPTAHTYNEMRLVSILTWLMDEFLSSDEA